MHRFLLLLHHKFKLEKYGENPPLFNLKIKNKLPHSKRLMTAKEIPQLKKKEKAFGIQKTHRLISYLGLKISLIPFHESQRLKTNNIIIETDKKISPLINLFWRYWFLLPKKHPKKSGKISTFMNWNFHLKFKSWRLWRRRSSFINSIYFWFQAY